MGIMPETVMQIGRLELQRLFNLETVVTLTLSHRFVCACH